MEVQGTWLYEGNPGSLQEEGGQMSPLLLSSSLKAHLLT